MEDSDQEGLLCEGEGCERDLLPENSDTHNHSWSFGRNLPDTLRSRKTFQLLGLLALPSICTNAIFLVLFFIICRGHHLDKPRYGIVGLLPNTVERTLSSTSLYANPPNLNSTLRDELWANIKWNRGMVVVDEETVSLRNLDDRAEKFPWDPSKRVYFLTAFHQLHCLIGIYDAINLYHGGGVLDEHHFEHLIHCLDAMRQDTMCTADDELLYVQHGSVFGEGQTRQCRDFSKLDEWALENNACYIFDDLKPPYFVNQRFANCPKDSPYYKTMVESFGFPEDWEPPNPPGGPTFPL